MYRNETAINENTSITREIREGSPPQSSWWLYLSALKRTSGSRKDSSHARTVALEQ